MLLQGWLARRPKQFEEAIGRSTPLCPFWSCKAPIILISQNRQGESNQGQLRKVRKRTELANLHIPIGGDKGKRNKYIYKCEIRWWAVWAALDLHDTLWQLPDSWGLRLIFGSMPRSNPINLLHTTHSSPSNISLSVSLCGPLQVYLFKYSLISVFTGFIEMETWVCFLLWECLFRVDHAA